MKKFLLILTFLPATLAAQKPNKHLDFCGWKYADTSIIRTQMQTKLDFLRINNHDTIVDIGAASGEFEGALSAIANFTNVHFVLVDIDSNCLNKTKVDNMVTYYSQVKGAPLNQTFGIVQNSPDSLNLPLNTYKKSWLINTLHEIPDRKKMVKDICAILKPGGELILLELLSRPKHTIHGGCKKPLLDEQEIKTLFEQNGFIQAEFLMNPNGPTKSKNPLYIVRFIKN